MIISVLLSRTEQRRRELTTGRDQLTDDGFNLSPTEKVRKCVTCMRTTLAISPPGVGTPQRFWWGGGGVRPKLWNPYPAYFRPKSVIFRTLFQTWAKIRYPISDQSKINNIWPRLIRIGFHLGKHLRRTANLPMFMGNNNIPCKQNAQSQARERKKLFQTEIPFFRSKPLKTHSIWGYISYIAHLRE